MLYDKDIREPLFDFLEEAYGKIRIIEEKTIGRSRADVMMVLEDSIAGIEIKSDADTYARLSRQVRDYNVYFDYNTVAVGVSHAMHIKEHIPNWWGIITVEEVDGKADFYIYRGMKPNPKPNLKRQLALLWRPELAHILAQNQLPRYPGKSKQFVIGALSERVEIKRLKRQMSEELFERDYTTIAKEIAEYKRRR